MVPPVLPALLDFTALVSVVVAVGNCVGDRVGDFTALVSVAVAVGNCVGRSGEGAEVGRTGCADCAATGGRVGEAITVGAVGLPGIVVGDAAGADAVGTTPRRPLGLGVGRVGVDLVAEGFGLDAGSEVGLAVEVPVWKPNELTVGISVGKLVGPVCMVPQ